jgi:hypothetical protein
MYLQVANNVLGIGEGGELRNRLFPIRDNFLRNAKVNLPQNSQSCQTTVGCCIFYYRKH